MYCNQNSLLWKGLINLGTFKKFFSESMNFKVWNGGFMTPKNSEGKDERMLLHLIDINHDTWQTSQISYNWKPLLWKGLIILNWELKK